MVDFELKGLDEVTRNIERLAGDIVDTAGRALFEEAQVEKAESMRRTPVDTGALRGSHSVSRPAYQGRQVEVTISVGGPAAPYAVAVHENLEAIHPVGRAKFLESTILESLPFLAARVARRMRSMLGA